MGCQGPSGWLTFGKEELCFWRNTLNMYENCMKCYKNIKVVVVLDFDSRDVEGNLGT